MLEIRENARSYVRFELRPKNDPVASQQKGFAVMKDVEYVLITPAYTRDVVVKEVKDWKDQIARQVAMGQMSEDDKEHYLKVYKHWKEGLEEPLDGTPIKGWALLTPAEQENLIHMHIRTVEDLAMINDEGMKRIGMGGLDMKNKARSWLAQADKGKASLEMARLTRENEQLKSTLETLQAQVQALMSKKEYVDVPHETQESGISAGDLLDDDDLKAQYKAKFGTAPHHKMKPETIRQKLME